MSGRCFSFSEVDRNVARWLFVFAIFNVLLGGMLGSAIMSSIPLLNEEVCWKR
jgi:membrane-anchored protein YejM (alkaline phosphatase superfamily)